MTVDYNKDQATLEPRYFLLFGKEGTWQEVSAASYRAAQVANEIKDIAPKDFQADTLRGTVTEDGSRPKDVKAEVVVEPMIRRSSDDEDASYRLIFPEGSYRVASMIRDDMVRGDEENFGTVTVILTPKQYQRFAKAQVPHAADKIAADLEARAEGANPIKGILLGGLAEGLRQIAADMRADKPSTRPSIKDLKDLLKG